MKVFRCSRGRRLSWRSTHRSGESTSPAKLENATMTGRCSCALTAGRPRAKQRESRNRSSQGENWPSKIPGYFESTNWICHVLELLAVRGNLYAFPTDFKLMCYLCSNTISYICYTMSYIVLQFARFVTVILLVV